MKIFMLERGNEMGEKYTKLQAVKSIIGRFDSVGETNEDEFRYDNLLDFEQIIYDLIRELVYESKRATRPQYSVKRSGKKALEIVREVSYIVEELIDERPSLIKALKDIDELLERLTLEQKKSLGATVYSIQASIIETLEREGR